MFYDVFNKRGYKLGHIMTNGFKDPLEVAKQAYGKNVDHVILWERTL
jgi:hypothetical protein